MKANELRIGNLVTDESNCPLEVFNILKTYVRVYIDNYLEELLIHYENLKPIPLTEEWLLKFGYEVLLLDGETKLYRFNSSDVSVHPEGGFTFGVRGVPIWKLYSVHDLQNSYYQFKKEELTIKEKPLTHSEGFSN